MLYEVITEEYRHDIHFPPMRCRSARAFAGARLFRPASLNELFLELHDHVMNHPVWRHPFFLRFAEGAFSRDEFLRFGVHYFNQVKNTRQCVALALGRFHSLMPMRYGQLNERVSELTQVSYNFV